MEILSVIINGLLALITGVYACLTWSISKRTKQTAEASERSAESASRAAQASSQSALLAEAALPVEFEIDIQRHSDGAVWFYVLPISANVYLHKLVANLQVIIDKSGEFVDAAPVELCPPDLASWSLPRFIHRGESIAFDWPNPACRTKDVGVWGHVDVEYSFAEATPKRPRSVFVESAPGVSDLAERYVHLLLAEDKDSDE
ncbi:hypothetical protein ABZS99_03840 [Streptomyces sp. NPDC005463]|uniref:hypothetical protein n=1 Tax=Streptomyces sp. NPDC005463 TaxID=3154465 RepID=UPI0033BBE922